MKFVAVAQQLEQHHEQDAVVERIEGGNLGATSTAPVPLGCGARSLSIATAPSQTSGVRELSWRRYAAWLLVFQSFCACRVVAGLAAEGDECVEQRQPGKTRFSLLVFRSPLECAKQAESARAASRCVFCCSESRHWWPIRLMCRAKVSAV